MLLALLWAGLTNVSATAFWAIGFLLLPAHQRWRTAVEQVIGTACKAHDNTETPAHDLDADQNRTMDAGPGHPMLLAQGLVAAALGEGETSMITGCVHEALRLRAQGALTLPSALDCCTPRCTAIVSSNGTCTAG